MNLVAHGTVRVRALANGVEWDERVAVHESDMSEHNDLVVEDVARDIARQQAGWDVETLECDLS